jgi:hypothetical protein
MAKGRKSIFETMKSDREIQDVARDVQKSSLDDIPIKRKSTPISKDRDKSMHLYVGKDFHRQAKVNASLRDMKLGAYIEWLIEQDKNLQ